MTYKSWTPQPGEHLPPPAPKATAADLWPCRKRMIDLPGTSRCQTGDVDCNDQFIILYQRHRCRHCGCVHVLCPLAARRPCWRSIRLERHVGAAHRQSVSHTLLVLPLLPCYWLISAAWRMYKTNDPEGDMTKDCACLSLCPSSASTNATVAVICCSVVLEM